MAKSGGKRGIFVVIAVSAVVLLPGGEAYCRTIKVRADGTGDCPTIQAAINDANDGDEIVCADGTYTGPGNREIEYFGKAITLRSENGAESCIIDCQRSGRAFRLRDYENGDSVVNGFTITNGYIRQGRGAAIYCYRSAPTISNCIIVGNINATDSMVDTGGGICCMRNSHAIITDCVIVENSGGGGIYCNESSPEITNCKISSNSGSGIYLYEGSPTITNCMISGNTAFKGGGVHCYRSSQPRITNSTISGNSASFYGGGIYCLENSNVTISNCIFWSNTAPRGNEMALVPSGDDSSIVSVTFSDFQGGEAGVYVVAPCALSWETGNISVYPDFIASDDYHLRHNSVCINAGDPAGEYGEQSDIDGEPRVVGGRVDIGADEFVYKQPPTLVGLEIAGPEGVVENFSAQYAALASYDDGSTRKMTTGVIWSVDPETYASIDGNGLLEAADIDTRGRITVSGEYTDGEVTLEAAITVRIYLSRTWYVPKDRYTIQAGINAAEDGDTIIVSDGIYRGSGNRDIRFLGKAITVRSETGPEKCIIDCQGSGRGFHFNSGEGKDSILDGFTVTDGRTDEYGYGGGISCRNSSPTVRNCVIIGNYATNGGGGIAGGYGTFTNCIISGNSAGWLGGGVFASHERFINCIISGNTSADGIGCWQDSNIEVVNCLISHNRGLGISCFLGSLRVSGSTIIGNSRSGLSVGHSSLRASNNIIWYNGVRSVSAGVSFVDVTYSDIEGGYQGVGNIEADPCFVDSDSNDYHLLSNSPCIDAGDPNYVAEPNETDLDGNPRVFADRIDMGAYEFNHLPVACVVGGDRVVEAGGDCEARVVLDGSCSSDADSTEGTNDDINDFDWYEVIDACEPNSDIYIGSGEVIECNLGLGEHLIILEVTDKAGAFDSNEVVITVEDVTPPEFSVVVEPNVLWPPNGKMVQVRPEWEVSDNCDEEVEVSLVDISMNVEGDVNNYVEMGDDGSIYLRARRSKGKDIRVYTLTYEAVDDSGNVTEASTTVAVRHRKGLRKLGSGLVRRRGRHVYRTGVQRR